MRIYLFPHSFILRTKRMPTSAFGSVMFSVPRNAERLSFRVGHSSEEKGSGLSGGSIVNQVQDVYNGLGQLTGEYQSHSGAVVQGSTPEGKGKRGRESNRFGSRRLSAPVSRDPLCLRRDHRRRQRRQQ